MSTVYWKCSKCGRSNQRRGVHPYGAEITPDNEMGLRCPGCGAANVVHIRWHRTFGYTPFTVSVKRGDA